MAEASAVDLVITDSALSRSATITYTAVTMVPLIIILAHSLLLHR
jgi:hypothetical protein